MEVGEAVLRCSTFLHSSPDPFSGPVVFALFEVFPALLVAGSLDPLFPSWIVHFLTLRIFF